MTPALALFLALSWIQVRSDTFIVKSSVGEERAIRVLHDLENFHQLIGSSLAFLNVNLPELPIEVLLIGDENQLNELAPSYKGRRLKVEGFYQKGQDRDFIVLSGSSRNTPTRVVYHELTHYFLSRALEHPPTWLGEGMAEYFSLAEISDTAIYLGGVSPELMDILQPRSQVSIPGHSGTVPAAAKEPRLMPLNELFVVDESSPYYNEADKANVFYAESWAFVHFLIHGGHRQDFQRYLTALSKGPAILTDYTNTTTAQLETEFRAYLQDFIRKEQRTRIKPSPIDWTMTVQPSSEADAQMSIAEIFLANGRLDLARKHLEVLAGMDDEFPRASYYRGILARITGVGDARELFVDALMDPDLATRAAIQLVKMHELHVPAARAELEKAAASGTRFADVYWALSEIYMNDLQQIEESMRISRAAQKAASLPALPLFPVQNGDPEPSVFVQYGKGSCPNLHYELLSENGAGPAVKSTTDPYFPDELLRQRLSGQVVLDVQITAKGEVGGLWLVSSIPDVFGDLATMAVRQWKFEAAPAKIRIILNFQP